jgi:PKD repeat protein
VAPLAEAGPDVTIDQHETVDFDGSGSSDNVGIVNWSWDFFYEGEDVTLYGVEASFTFHEAGEVGVTLKVMDLGGLVGSDTMTVRVLDITPPVADAGTTRNIDQHETVTFRGTGSTDNVGVINWTWTFMYEVDEVTLYGPDPEFTFDDAGQYNVSLTVADAVGLTATDWVMVYVKDITDPAADAGPDLEVDQHETVTLDASASSDNVDIVNWTWSFVYRGSPMKLYGEVVEFVFDDAGTYEISLAVNDGTGNMGLDSVTVRVLDITPPTPDAGEDMEVVQGSNVDLDGTGSRDNIRIASYTWTFDYQGVPIELIGSTPSYYFDAAGEYLVTLTVADLEGNDATDTVRVVVLDTEAPVADAGEDIFVDQGDTVDLVGTGSTDNVGVTSWVWTFTYEGEAKELTGPTPSFVFDEAGVYTIDLVVEDARGNSHDDLVRVTVRDVTPPVADAGDDRQSDQGTAVTLDGSGSTDNLGVETYTWTFEYGGSIETLTGRTVQFPFDVPGDYTVTLTVADAAGNEATDDFDLHVRDTLLPVPPSMSSIETGAGDEVTLDGSAATDNVGVVKWTWTFKEGGKTRTLEGQKVKHTFEDAGDYEVTLTVEDAEGNTASTTFDVTVTSSSWLWIAIVVVLVVLVAAAFLMLRRRGGGEEEGADAPEVAEEKPEIIIEERFAE